MATLWTVEKVLVDRASGSRKFLLRSTGDGVVIEVVMVWFAFKGKASVCTSTQRGCALACPCCATTFSSPRFQGDLTAEEIVAEVEVAAEHSADIWEAASEHQVVYEGHGEPALNLDAVLEATARLRAAHPEMIFKMVSCCPRGFLETLLALPDHVLVPELRISLHGATREKRGALIPVVADYDCARLVAEAIELAQKRGFPVTMNYLVHEGNASEEDARNLADLLRPGKEHFKLRLLPMNPVAGSAFRPVGDEAFRRFGEAVRVRLPEGFFLDLHRNFGQDDTLQFACGQLRAHAVASKE